jgi:putative flippase GtrA
MKNNIVQFLKYGIGGGLAFVLTSLSLYFLTEQLKIYYLLSSAIAYIFGFVLNFIFQAYITFKTKASQILKRLSLFALIQLFGLLLFTLIIFILTEKLLLYYFASYLISALLVFIFNFSLSKYFVFK